VCCANGILSLNTAEKSTTPRHHSVLAKKINYNTTMTDYMFKDDLNEEPAFDQTQFTDVTNSKGTNTERALLKSCQRILARLEATGELTSNEVSDLAEAPKWTSGPQEFESYVWLRVCPTLASHPLARWGDCWKHNPDKALSEDEFKAIASDFDVPAVHESHQRVNADNDPRVHYPKVIKGWYDFLRDTYEDDTPRHGVSGEELTNNTPVLLPESDYSKCAEYLAEFPDIERPSHPTDRPDFAWVESDTDAEATDAATSEVEA